MKILLLIFLVLMILISGCTKFKTPDNIEVLSLPVNKEDISFRYNGIWPYGVQGGDHPHGHPGIDFESDSGKPIIAVDDGTITVFQTNIGKYGEDTMSFISDSLGDGYEIYYTGSMKDFQVQENSRVKRGDVLAYFRPWIEANGVVLESGYIHFEVHTRNIGRGGSNCPYNFMTNESKRELKEIFTQSTYQKKDQFPLICNPCPEGGCY